LADGLNDSMGSGEAVAAWSDSMGSVSAKSSGTPILVKDALGGRSVVRFNPADGADRLNVPSANSPLALANDFSVVVAFATSHAGLRGGTQNWYDGTGLVDANTLGFGDDWGISLNSAGQVGAGIGAGFGQSPASVFSTATGLNDGQMHVATLTRSGRSLAVYVDDGPATSRSDADADPRSRLDFVFGDLAGGNGAFTGDIAQVRIYNGALSATEVRDMYRQLYTYYNNSPPSANPDVYETHEDNTFFSVPASSGLLSNDTDAESDPLTAVLDQPPMNGTLALNADGSFLYLPNRNFFGTDQFTYVARDTRPSAPATVTIQVRPTYDPATAVNDAYYVLAGNILNVDAASGLQANDINPDRTALRAVVRDAVPRGNLALRPDGSFTYDPQGFAGRTQFTYELADAVGRSNAATVSLTVNTPPVAHDDRFQTPEDTSLSLTTTTGVLGNDVDAERNSLAVTLIDAPSHGVLSLRPDGSLTYTPELDFVGQDRFTYRLNDGIDDSAIANAVIEITAVNDRPSPRADSYFGLLDEPLRVEVARGVLANDIDVDSSALFATLVSPPTSGTLEFRADGSFVYQPRRGFTGQDQFTYTASDGLLASAPATVTIGINSLSQQQGVVINEIHADPLVKTELVEFIELYNRGDVAIDLSGWSIRDAVDFTFPAGSSIPAKGYVTVTQNGAMFSTKYSKTPVGEWLGGLNNEGELIELRNAGGTLIDRADYQLGFPWPTYGDATDVSMQLLNANLDNELGGSWRSAAPTPGLANSVVIDNAPPQIRQVTHEPALPRSATDVTITARVTDPDGVKSVTLEYQDVAPGNYIKLTDAAYGTSWQSIAMRDDGRSGDATANDGMYTDIVPATVQRHRHLVRYRINSSDARDASVRVPYADDPQPNFAYYVYDAIPNWTGSARPGTAPNVTYNFNEMSELPVYQLISKNQDVVDAQFHPGTTRSSGYTGSDYLWSGTLVYGDRVYDHIRYRARGGVWRYSMGKNMWKFDFNTGHDFQAHDEFGEKYATQWDKLNFSAIIQQGDYLHRGEHGLFEAVGFKLFNLMNVEASKTHYVHFRVVDSAEETGTTQYNTDFWGLYLAIEQPDGRLLDEHGLPDGNLYKIEDYVGTSNNQGPTQVSDGSDVRDFIRAYRRSVDEQFWRDNLDLPQSFSYRSVVESIHHYDIAYGKNYFYYHNPETGLFEEIPWDLDLTWADNMFGDGNHDFKRKVHDNPAFQHEYRNRMREYRDLLYNPEQTGLLIDQQAAYIYTPGEPSWVDADRAMWDYNPILTSRQVNSSKAGHGRFYQRASTKDFPGMIKLMKDYVVSRGRWIDQRILNDADLTPLTPTIEYAGPNGYPVDRLTFRTSAYSDPQSDAFAGLQWRIAEVTDPATYRPGDPIHFEITPAWQSPELTEFQDQITMPTDALQVGHTYRVRVRMKDSAGHWSHWSGPIQFVAAPPTTSDVAAHLRISELHYNPAEPTAAELIAGFTDNDEFEFIEFVNTGSRPIDIRDARLEEITTEDGNEGVSFDFSGSPITVLGPGQRVLVVEDLAAFETRYGADLPVAGEWSGQLSNGGETITVSAFGTTFLQFAYNDAWYAATDGVGHSLEAVNPTSTSGAAWSQVASWKASQNSGGSPGRGSSTDVPGDSNHDGIFNSSDLVVVFAAGEYEDGTVGNSTFEEGDWNGDGDFTTSDLIFAFQGGGYVAAAHRTDQDQELAARILALDDLEMALDSRSSRHGLEARLVIPDPRRNQLAVRDLVFDDWSELPPTDFE
jgi:hypothetical protein